MGFWRKKEPKLDTSKAGGVAFFTSLGGALIAAPCIVAGLLVRLDVAALERILPFAASVGVGALGAAFLIRGHIAVFIHELKHSIVANLVGNKARGWRIRRDHGHFEYEFTEQTRKFNALIAVAPYWLPVCTIAALAVAYAGWWHAHTIMLRIVGLGWGADLALIARDLGPHQTDFVNLRGGYRVGLTYVIAMNTCVGGLLLAWVSGGPSGVTALFHGLITALHGLWARAYFAPPVFFS